MNVTSSVLYRADCRMIIPLVEYDSVVTDPWYGAVTESDTRQLGDGYPEWCLSWFDLLHKPILMTVGSMNVEMWEGLRKPDALLAWYKPMGGQEPVLGWGEFSGDPWFRTGPDEIDAAGYRSKPLEWAIEMVKRVPGKVLDPFMGKGVVGLACKELGRDFVGIEHNPELFKVAQERLG